MEEQPHENEEDPQAPDQDVKSILLVILCVLVAFCFIRTTAPFTADMERDMSQQHSTLELHGRKSFDRTDFTCPPCNVSTAYAKVNDLLDYPPDSKNSLLHPDVVDRFQNSSSLVGILYGHLQQSQYRNHALEITIKNQKAELKGHQFVSSYTRNLTAGHLENTTCTSHTYLPRNITLSYNILKTSLNNVSADADNSVLPSLGRYLRNIRILADDLYADIERKQHQLTLCEFRSQAYKEKSNKWYEAYLGASKGWGECTKIGKICAEKRIEDHNRWCGGIEFADVNNPLGQLAIGDSCNSTVNSTANFAAASAAT